MRNNLISTSFLSPCIFPFFSVFYCMRELQNRGSCLIYTYPYLDWLFVLHVRHVQVANRLLYLFRDDKRRVRSWNRSITDKVERMREERKPTCRPWVVTSNSQRASGGGDFFGEMSGEIFLGDVRWALFWGNFSALIFHGKIQTRNF